MTNGMTCIFLSVSVPWNGLVRSLD